jgi:hypothetical protein
VRVSVAAAAGVRLGSKPGKTVNAFGNPGMLMAATKGNELATFSARLMNW